MSLIRAHNLATEWHMGQTRKYTGLPYESHLANVASLARAVTGDCEPEIRRDILCTAWLHDILEDTECPFEVVVETAGYQVADWVQLLTEPTIEGNREERKKFYAGVLSQSPNEVKIVKLCDIIDNVLGITALDPEFARTYVAEKEFLLQHLTCGNEPLHQLAERVVRAERIALNRYLRLPLLGGEEATH